MGCSASEGAVAPQASAAASGPAVIVTVGDSARPGSTATLRLLPRASANRVDVTTAARVKLLYVLPSDGTDRRRDTDGSINRSIGSGQRWLASQTGGRTLRFDLSDDALDITYVRLPRAEATYFGFGAFIRDSIQKDLRAAGWTQRDVLLLAYYEGRHVDRCASAAWPPVIAGSAAVVYLHGAPESELPCDDNEFAESPNDAPGYMEFVVLHELFHLLGVVSPQAPDQALSGHVTGDPTDLMYAGTRPWRPATVDVSKRNYYSPSALPSGVKNFAESPFVIAP
jgi:hypothetical protein